MVYHRLPFFSLCILAALASSAPASAQTRAAVSPEMLNELSSELDRGMKELALPGEPRPYFIAYKLTEVDVNNVAASLGSVTASQNRNFMGLDSHVRVGSYKFDNSNYLIPQQENRDGHATISLALEATPRTARRAAWLATDSAYKEALQQFTAKKVTLDGAPGLAENAPSYTREPPTVMMDDVKVEPMESLDELRTMAEKVSATFRGQDHIRESRVAYTSFIERRWYLNSEGTRAHDIRRVSGVVVVATTQAEDGEVLSLYATHYGRTKADLPGVADLQKEARELSDQLRAMQTAPLIGNYTGPVLFEDAGAAGIVRESLTKHLAGTPVPIGVPGNRVDEFGGAFNNRVGQRVTSTDLNIADDPTTSRGAGRHLIGGYRFDDEGVKPQRVSIVERGRLERLLMSRTPSEAINKSNGHARRSGPGLYLGSTTNLFLSPAGRGQTRKALRKQLTKLAKDQGLDYGLVVKRFDDVHVTANGEMGGFELVASLQSVDRAAPPPVLLAYRVYPNGKEELVRGVQLQQVTPRAWRDVAGVGRKPFVFNYLATDADGTSLRLQGGEEGFVPSGGVESAVVTPDLLFEELDVVRGTGSRPPAPAVKRP